MVKTEKPKKGAFHVNQLSGTSYSDETVFRVEKKKIFNRSWLFAGSSVQIPNDNDFLVLNLVGESIIVGRYKGKIRAFENRCPHRSSAIHNCESGNRELKCPFHGWTFDEKGAVRAIPQQREAFDFSDPEKMKLGLKSYEVEMVGQLMFVRMSECKQNLKDFLGPMRESLLAFDAKWTTQNSWETNQPRANWKILVETALESYHTSETHPVSLGVQNQVPLEYYTFTSTKQGHQILNIGNHPDARMTTTATIMFVFPNLFLIQLDGTLSSVLTFFPHAADLTTVRSYAYISRKSLLGSAAIRSMEKAVRHTNFEDQRVCENIQSQISRHKKGQPLATIEKAIYQFQRDYLKRISFWRF